MSVTGLPEPRADHAVAMARFARECRERFTQVTQKLEVSLGPETADLCLRIGLHSGPVTAGVLRGQKSRFQLFGDTVNTAARMESTGTVNMIHISQATADILIKSKKGAWLQPRRDKVEVKGKGQMQTYWVEPKARATTGSTTGSEPTDNKVTSSLHTLDSKTERLVSWNVDVLGRMLSKIQVRRNLKIGILERNSTHQNHHPHKRGKKSDCVDMVWSERKDCMVLDEVKEVIELPEFEASFMAEGDDYLLGRSSNSNILNDKARVQLREYVTAIAAAYRDHGFHNFEHASHVCMSVAKLLSRIVAPDQVLSKEDSNSNSNYDNGSGGAPLDSHINLASDLHDHTYGITSDPLTQFACLFAALIHDVDHPGVGNAQLVREGHALSRVYRGKSVAEQNSVNMAWTMLLDCQYAALREAICDTQEEEARFRQLVVNAVMSTDIMDPGLKRLREDRWDAAFSPDSEGRIREDESDRVMANRKATIVIEYLIQASDVAHTMQHWHIYTKWNERFFNEMHRAYQDGRADRDPTEFWYEGEISFFDNYIIPLAKKLSECGVFGVSSDEYLNYAIMNRNEWEKKGKTMVEDYVTRLKSKRDNKLSSKILDLQMKDLQMKEDDSVVEGQGLVVG